MPAKTSPSPSTSLPPAALLTTLSSLLALELHAETTQNALLLSSAPPTLLARAGLALLNLSIASYRTGLGGRTVLELVLDAAVVPKDSRGELPEHHGIRTGDIVRVGERPREAARKREVREVEKGGVEGVVVRVGERGVWVAVGREGRDRDEEGGGIEQLGDGKLWLVKLANDVTYRRMDQALSKLTKTPEEQYTTLQRVLFGLSQPSAPDLASVSVADLSFLDPTLNASQRDAVRFALASPDLALIHGPPGTGKTYTLIELILQLVQRGQRVLVCGPSNISVDNIVERLAATAPGTPIVRLGHPARLLPGVLGHSLEVLTKTSEQAQLIGDVRREIDEKMASVRKVKGRAAKGEVWREVRELRKEYREREGRVTRELVGGAKVVLSTLHGAGGRDAKRQDGQGGYDVLVVDEAAQAVEPQCWVPIVMAGEVRKVVLAGDHMQLPPTVKGKDAEVDKAEEKKRVKTLEEALGKLSLDDGVAKKAKGWSLERTMFDRLLELYGGDIKRLLKVQYRMHERIMRFPSDELYDGKLVAADGVEARLLKDLNYEVEDTDDTREPLVFYDTQGGDFPERTEEGLEDGKVKKSVLLGDSKSNDMEAAVVRMHVEALTAAGVKAEDIAVVTPYNAQLAILSGMLREKYPGLEMGSVDGFQGREKEAVIVSLVRSNPEREVGFLGEKRRLNVAMTRPKRHLCVIGDSETVSRGSSFLKRWMKFLEDEADLRYPSLDELELG
ncbi:uncharacterized protein HMPREF1541_02831 [Cyphellophora europaea CBS 101466]|uniref:DNA helicase n=1 Tax=Cyphellophora europaea (strain CBS 101466) TaxID=1220924 RepID=W2S4Q3_CYPE1|nr:uncharacterized protein HMPREF1541_02831 [Cyphellophora europaea CBS 101466]ETN43672.1 hypothetical protein HMPREF1541_02831 [Cyphellophora europaea CBS 101466]